ncbi:hypothetical protein PV396_42630 [Streptomyces sp. ME02-8801-2C]|uniref:hypothetical protein n=1 Tax=Streptomyces sp. ME02-8801-2C TaxID=3028680 RepID=UPI0029A28E86|nr:hypothetical protein [Streptomyces sp. ME02-8801-2C]MDX3458559.1 hypothetical protein [Streptomyces sp. ME02-8801-2C]
MTVESRPLVLRSIWLRQRTTTDEGPSEQSLRRRSPYQSMPDLLAGLVLEDQAPVGIVASQLS